jgi:hypothetical protein
MFPKKRSRQKGRSGMAREVGKSLPMEPPGHFASPDSSSFPEIKRTGGFFGHHDGFSRLGTQHQDQRHRPDEFCPGQGGRMPTSGRAFMPDPELLCMGQPSTGLAPQIRQAGP